MRNLFLALATLGVFGCEVYSTRGVRDGLVLETDQTFQSYQFQPGNARLTAGSQRALAAFMARLPQADSYLIATLPQSEPRLMEARAATLRGALGVASHELGFENGNASDTQGRDSGTLRAVRVRRAVAHCEVGPPVSPCSNTANLAAMLADPADLAFTDYRPRYHAPKAPAPSALVDGLSGAAP